MPVECGGFRQLVRRAGAAGVVNRARVAGQSGPLGAPVRIVADADRTSTSATNVLATVKGRRLNFRRSS
ncbi:MAG: hypothetical protein QM736_04045 [Vicinamibacterales bacterium]